MLASDEDSGTLDALRFSLASDIVELVVLTGDDVFLQTMRDAVGSTRRLWHVASGDKVSDLLVAGEVGIVMLDVQALIGPASDFVAQIKRQFPDLVIVVAGSREDETTLASLISAGVVYRFIHKPMSPARARLFAEAAVRKYDEQRRRAAQLPLRLRETSSKRNWVVGLAAVAVAATALGVWLHHAATEAVTVPAIPAAKTSADSVLLARAAVAMAANRLTEPSGDNALELYLQAQARYPADPQARAGLLEVHERLLARAENALLEERLDEAAQAIETARRAGVESGRIAFLTAQLAKSREQLKPAQAQLRSKNEPKIAADRIAPLLNLAATRLEEGHLIDPEQDSARYFIQQALQLDAADLNALEAQRQLGIRLLAEARSAIDRRDFPAATNWIEEAADIASSANIESVQNLLAIARQEAAGDARRQLLKKAEDRLQQDRLIEPANDSAKYYLLTLRGMDGANPELPAAFQDLGGRLLGKSTRALSLGQLTAARSWLEEAASISFSSAESTALQQQLDAAVAQQRFLTSIIPSSQLTVLKTVQPVYPKKAAVDKLQGWVEVDFTVGESGEVKDLVVHAASEPGAFDDAAIKAVAQWHYQPVLQDGKPVPTRTRVRIRFAGP